MKNPYIGPRPFAPGDHTRFFGRDREIEEITSHLFASRVLVLYAESGAGKTSLLNAGVLPEVAGDFHVLPVSRVAGTVPRGVDEDAIPNLAVHHALTAWNRKYPAIDPTSMTLADAVAATATAAGSRPTLLVFDQFEELFTGFVDRPRDRAGFFRQLGECLRTSQDIKVLLSLREDFLGRFNAHVGRLFVDYRHRRYRLERLREKPARQAVLAPLAHGDPPREFADGVAEKLVRDLLQVRLAGRADPLEGEFVEPVQLQVVCETLWANLAPDVEVITEQHAREHGDVTEALTTFYTNAIVSAKSGFRGRESKVRAFFGDHLITPTGTRGTVVEEERTTGGIPNRVVGALQDAHVVRAEESRGARWYELTHDRLIEPVRAANRAWRARRLRRLAIGGGVAAAVAIIALSATTTALIQESRSPNDPETAVSYVDADLRGNDFSSQELSGEDFSGADLSGANFTGATLVDAKMVNSNLTEAIFTDAIMIRADLSGAVVTGATFLNTDLTSTILRGVSMDGTAAGDAFGGRSANYVLASTALNANALRLFGLYSSTEAAEAQSVLSCADRRESAHAANFTEAILRGANLTEAQLAGADLSKAQLDDADLTSADLRCASLVESSLRNATVVDANLTDADLSTAVLVGANLSDAMMNAVIAIGTDFSEAQLQNTQLVDADLSRATFGGATLGGTGLDGARLATANLDGVNLTQIGRADLFGSDLSGVRLVGANLGLLDLTGSSLVGADLSEASLTGTVLTGADLTNAQLGRATLQNAVLRQARLVSADLRSSDLTGANLVGADLTNTDLVGAVLVDADLTGADLTLVRDKEVSGVDFRDATLSNATLDGMALGGLSFTNADLSEARLVNASLVAATLVDADLQGAVLTNTSFVGADLSGANIAGALALGSDFSGADLTELSGAGSDVTGASFAGAVLAGADFGGANLTRANLGSVDLTLVGLRGVRLTNANLARANLGGVDMSGGSLAGATLAEANLAQANLGSADLSGANLAEATLTGARLGNANLRSSNLIAADLDGANLDRARLDSAVLTLASLRDASLANANLSGANLAQVDLTGAAARKANLTRADLTGAIVVSAVLPGANFSAASLTNADLSESDLSGADFRNGVRFVSCETKPDLVLLATRTTETQFSGADLSGALLDGVDLSRANGLGRWEDLGTGLVLGPTPANLSGVSATGASFPDEMREAQLRGAMLECSDFTASDLTRSDLSGADLTSARLTRVAMVDNEISGSALGDGGVPEPEVPEPGTLLEGATFVGADLSDTDIRGVVFDGVDLSSANMAGALLRESSFVGANLSDVDFTDAVLGQQSFRENDIPFEPAILLRADLTDADFEAADLTRVEFTNADLSHAVLSNAIVDFADLSTANIQYSLLDVLSDDGTSYPSGFDRPAIIGNADFLKATVQVDSNSGSIWTSGGSDFERLDPYSLAVLGVIQPTDEISVSNFAVTDAATWAVTLADSDGLPSTFETDVSVARVTADGSVMTHPLPSSCGSLCPSLSIEVIDDVAWVASNSGLVSAATFTGEEINSKTLDLTNWTTDVEVAGGYVWATTSTPDASGGPALARINWTTDEVVYIPIGEEAWPTAEAVVAFAEHLWIVTEVSYEDPNDPRVDTVGALYRVALDEATAWDGTGPSPAVELVLAAAHGGDIIAADGLLWISQQGQRAIVGVDPQFLAITNRLCTATGRLRLICGDADRDNVGLSDLAYDAESHTLWATTRTDIFGTSPHSLIRIQLQNLDPVGEVLTVPAP